MDNKRNSRNTREPDYRGRAMLILGQPDYTAIEAFEHDLNALSSHDIQTKQESHLGPVTRDWPIDGMSHMQDGLCWAYGIPKHEIIAAPLLLCAFWGLVIYAWLLTASISHWKPGMWGYLLGWLSFILLVVTISIALRGLVQLAFTFLESSIAAKNRPGVDYDYE